MRNRHDGEGGLEAQVGLASEDRQGFGEAGRCVVQLDGVSRRDLGRRRSTIKTLFVVFDRCVGSGGGQHAGSLVLGIFCLIRVIDRDGLGSQKLLPHSRRS